jgi:hypothetical protein
LVVSSWRFGHRFERIAVGYDDFERFQRGDEVVIQAQKGVFGIPWVYGVYRP